MAAKNKKKAEEKENRVFISEADQYVFAQGSHYDIYKKLGKMVSKACSLVCGHPMQQVYMS